jgi:ABC-type multidrug transport system ATPase subunit
VFQSFNQTTFLTTLAGRAVYGTELGTVLINGKQGSLDTWKKLVGFVPQDDVMHRTLTVREAPTLFALIFGFFSLPESDGSRYRFWSLQL